ncbi:hypothetical protein L1887_63492 [Cichorium endivia]|nr:hypothetical protein L1887_63492 [Cichorium endivia]
MLALGPLQQLVEVGRRDGAVMRSYRRHRVWVVRCRIRRTSSEVRLRWIMCKTCESDSMKNENDAKDRCPKNRIIQTNRPRIHPVKPFSNARSPKTRKPLSCSANAEKVVVVEKLSLSRLKRDGKAVGLKVDEVAGGVASLAARSDVGAAVQADEVLAAVAAGKLLAVAALGGGVVGLDVDLGLAISGTLGGGVGDGSHGGDEESLEEGHCKGVGMSERRIGERSLGDGEPPLAGRMCVVCVAGHMPISMGH